MKESNNKSFKELRKEWELLNDGEIFSTPNSIYRPQKKKNYLKYFTQTSFLIVGFPSLLILAFFAFYNTTNLDTNRPNIVFILTDDQRWDAIGYSGNKHIITPEMDKLASEGIYFSHAFATTPTCTSSRASILSSMYEYQHQYGNFSDPVDSQILLQSYPLLLKKEGYTTGFYGKFGLKYDSLALLFDEFENYSINTDYPDKRGYFYKTIEKDTVHLTKYTGHKAVEYIKQASQSQPFCLSISFNAPHAHDTSKEQYFWQSTTDTYYANVALPKPKLLGKRFFDTQPIKVKEGLNKRRWRKRFSSEDKYQNSVKGYYRLISGIDIEVGKIRKALEDKGIADNTIIIFMGDNGYFLGERRLAGKWLMYEHSLRIPLIIYDPRKKVSKTVNDLVLNLDIPATILDFAGIEIPTTYEGITLKNFTHTNNQKEVPNKRRPDFFCEHLRSHARIPASEGIRTSNWKYFRYLEFEQEELYDLRKDPLEKNNIIKDSTHFEIINILKDKLEAKNSQNR